MNKGAKKKEYPSHLDKEDTDTECLIVSLSARGYLVSHLCGRTQPFPKRQTKLFIDAEEEKGWAHLVRPMIFPRIWKDKAIAKNLTLELFPLIVALAM